jgi:hypothetical protein
MRELLIDDKEAKIYDLLTTDVSLISLLTCTMMEP